MSAGLASWLTVSRAVGAASVALTVMLAVAGLEAWPPVSVTTKVTVYVPAAA